MIGVPASRTEVRAGVSLSLSGPFRLQGEQALHGLQLWAEYFKGEEGVPLRLLVLDDRSQPSLAKANVLRLLGDERVDLLIGPYSSGLTLAVAPLAAARGKILWNHGGASDVLFERGWRHLVSVLSPASEYFRALPRLVRRRHPGATRLAVLVSKRGSFGASVARGVAETAKAAGMDRVRQISFDSPVRDPRALLREALGDEPDVLVGAGGFDDDVMVARARDLLERVKLLAFVGAGLEAFHHALGEQAEDIIGPSQWEPGSREAPLVGPTSEWFCSEFERTFRLRPEYPAAQAFALGVVIRECLRRAGTLEDEPLLQAARALETTTFYGAFRLDAETSRQVGHRMLLVQWREGRKVVLDDG